MVSASAMNATHDLGLLALHVHAWKRRGLIIRWLKRDLVQNWKITWCVPYENQGHMCQHINRHALRRAL
jgi:hypothetical protein